MSKSLENFLQKLIVDNSSYQDKQNEELINTSLGPQLFRKEENIYSINLSEINPFIGLNMICRSIIAEVIEQCGFGFGDISVKHKIDPKLSPEFFELGVNWILLYSRFDISEGFLWKNQEFTNKINTVLNTIQYEKWGSILFPHYFGKNEQAVENLALLFPFSIYDLSKDSFYVLVEYNIQGKFLRLTIESGSQSRLQLKHIKHRVVDNISRYPIFEDIDSFTNKIYYSIIKEIHRHNEEHIENINENGGVFENFIKFGFSDINKISFSWSIFKISENEKNILKLNQILKKLFYLLEDNNALNLIKNGNKIKILDGNFESCIINARKGQILKISLGTDSNITPVDYYLDQMPELKNTTEMVSFNLQNVRVFLIHHITAEVIGLIRALNKLGAENIITFFVKYGGIIPETYLDTILSLPDESYLCHSLFKKDDSGGGFYTLSPQFFNYEYHNDLDELLKENENDFLAAMRQANLFFFIKELFICIRLGKKLIVIEDGGYLMPLINKFCNEDISLADILKLYKYNTKSNLIKDLNLSNDELASKFKFQIKDTLIGGIEHTKNGYDANFDIEKIYKKLFVPVCSIAISDFKTIAEANECCYSIVNAIENVMNRLGLVFSLRNILILGSSGKIGKNIFDYLSFRISMEKIYGIDIAYEKIDNTSNKFNFVDELPQKMLHNIDMIIGVVGKSIVSKEIFEEIILNGNSSFLILASGSTKTVEFAEIENYLMQLFRSETPTIREIKIEISSVVLRDLQTGMELGTSIKIKLLKNEPAIKYIYLLGNLTPVNFIYYGIPREIIDKVLSQLLKVTLGLVEKREKLPPRLLAVDKEITENADMISEVGKS